MITYSEIRNVQRMEKESNNLQDLGENFLVELSEYINDKKKIILKNKDDSNPFSKEMDDRARSEMENALRVIDMLFQMREKKRQTIVMIAVRMGNNDVIYSFNTVPEQVGCDQLFAHIEIGGCPRSAIKKDVRVVIK